MTRLFFTSGRTGSGDNLQLIYIFLNIFFLVSLTRLAQCKPMMVPSANGTSFMYLSPPDSPPPTQQHQQQPPRLPMLRIPQRRPPQEPEQPNSTQQEPPQQASSPVLEPSMRSSPFSAAAYQDPNDEATRLFRVFDDHNNSSLAMSRGGNFDNATNRLDNSASSLEPAEDEPTDSTDGGLLSFEQNMERGIERFATLRGLRPDQALKLSIYRILAAAVNNDQGQWTVQDLSQIGLYFVEGDMRYLLRSIPGQWGSWEDQVVGLQSADEGDSPVADRTFHLDDLQHTVEEVLYAAKMYTRSLPFWMNRSTRFSNIDIERSSQDGLKPTEIVYTFDFRNVIAMGDETEQTVLI